MPDLVLIASLSAACWFGLSRLCAVNWAKIKLPWVRKERRGTPLRQVVAKCEAKWFLEELQLAMQGDRDAYVKVGHMLLAGYGVHQDAKEAAAWLRKVWAVQNFQDPACLDALDIKDSAIHKLNTEGGASRRKRTTQQCGPDSDPNRAVERRGQAFDQTFDVA